MMEKSPQKIVIVGNGEDWQKDKIIYFCREADYLIAADNGLALLHKFKLTPHLIIGDLDSVSSTLLPQYSNIPVERYPGKKDFPDSELGIQKAISMNPQEITLLAVTGNYFDHSYAVIVNLFRYYQEDIKIKIITSNSVIFPITRKISLTHLKGRRFSLFPLSPVKNISMTGAQYQFPRKNLKVTDYSLSNVVVQEKLEINLERGMLFCVLFDKGFR
ncbi:MAG: thiamine diphosphokinase [Candidatus Caldatribacteriota bacterium]